MIEVLLSKYNEKENPVDQVKEIDTKLEDECTVERLKFWHTLKRSAKFLIIVFYPKTT